MKKSEQIGELSFVKYIYVYLLGDKTVVNKSGEAFPQLKHAGWIMVA